MTKDVLPPSNGYSTLIDLSEREQLLRAIPFFTKLNMAEIASIAGLLVEVHFASGEAVVTEGEIVDSVYILVTGNAEVTQKIAVQKTKGSSLLAVLRRGETIGLKDSTLFSETGSRTATVTATSPCLLLKLDLAVLNDFFDKHPDILSQGSASIKSTLRMRLIKEIAPFSPLNNEKILWLANQVKELNLQANQIIFNEGDASDSCYLIVDGSVEIIRKETSGETKVLAELKAPRIFGESAFLSSSKRNATAKTVTACKLLMLDQDLLQELIAQENDTPETLLSLVREYNRPIRLPNIIYQQRELADGQTITTLKNPLKNNYYQLTEQGWFIWSQLNGNLTMQELTHLFSEQYKGADLDEVLKVIQGLEHAGFIALDVSKNTEEDQEDNKAIEKTKGVMRAFNLKYFLPQPDLKFSFLYRFTWPLLSIPALIIYSLLIIAGFYVLPKALFHSVSVIKDSSNLYLWCLALIALCLLLQMINPIVKGLTIKKLKKQVNYWGFVWKGIGPVGFIDTSDMWLCSPYTRAMVTLSGLIGNLVMASLLSVWAYYLGNTGAAFFIALMALVIYLQTLRMLDPLLNSEGYECLTQLFNDSNIRQLFTKPGWGLSGRKEKAFLLYCLGYLLLVLLATWCLQYVLLKAGYSYSYLSLFTLPACLFFVELLLEIRYQKNMLSLRNNMVANHLNF